MNAAVVAVLSELDVLLFFDSPSLTDVFYGHFKKRTLMYVCASFQDSSIGTSIPVLELIDAVQPESVNFELVKECQTDEDKMDNAK